MQLSINEKSNTKNQILSNSQKVDPRDVLKALREKRDLKDSNKNEKSPTTHGEELWKNALDKVKTFTKGSFEGCSVLYQDYYLEHLDPKHQYGKEQITRLVPLWLESNYKNYFEWLEDYRKTHPATEEDSFVDYIGHKKLFGDTEAKIVDGHLVLKDSFPKEWLDEIKNNPEGKTKLKFVVDKDYNLHVASKFPTKDGRLQHSSFYNGAPVRLGGIMKVDQDLKVTFMSSDTGHYRSEASALYDVVKHMDANHQIDITKLKVQQFGEEKLVAADFIKCYEEKMKEKHGEKENVK